VLLNLEALTQAGVVDDPRLNAAVILVLSKQDKQGRWALEYGYHGKMWIDIEKKSRPSKWVTLRALRVLTRLGVDVAHVVARYVACSKRRENTLWRCPAGELTA